MNDLINGQSHRYSRYCNIPRPYSAQNNNFIICTLYKRKSNILACPKNVSNQHLLSNKEQISEIILVRSARSGYNVTTLKNCLLKLWPNTSKCNVSNHRIAKMYKWKFYIFCNNVAVKFYCSCKFVLTKALLILDSSTIFCAHTRTH